MPNDDIENKLHGQLNKIAAKLFEMKGLKQGYISKALNKEEREKNRRLLQRPINFQFDLSNHSMYHQS